MKNRFLTIFILALIVSFSSIMSAQQSRAVKGLAQNPGTGFPLLRLPNVQKELKLSADQKQKIEIKAQEVNDLIPESAPDSTAPVSEEEQRKLQAKQEDLQVRAVVTILADSQLKQLQQLMLQLRGPALLLHKEIAAELELTEAQQKTIRDIVRKSAEERSALLKSSTISEMTAEHRRKLKISAQAHRKITEVNILAVFNEAQKKQWKEILGDPFQF